MPLISRTLVALLAAFTGPVMGADSFADAVYSGGPILTMNDASPRAEAVATLNGRILAVGTLEDLRRHRGPDTQSVDLAGRTLIPGFVDSHGHVVLGGLQALSANLLAPPDGKVTDIASLQATLKAWMAANKDSLEESGVVIGFGYDNAQLAELRHPLREELDAVSTDYPIIIVHQSGHLGVANSKALAAAGIDANTPNPDGGVIRKDDKGVPNGVLEEYAFFGALVPTLGALGPQANETFAKAGSQMWASFGYTTGQEGRASAAVVEALKVVGAAGDLPIDVVAYPDVLEGRDYIADNVSRDYRDRVRVGGCKLTIDGSPQGFTALRDRPYYAPVGDYPEAYAGYAAVTEEQVNEAVAWCLGNDIQVITHANGEGASDMLIEALDSAYAKQGRKDALRPVLIHGQFLRQDQLDSYQRLGVFPSLFPMHTFYWGDWHRDHTVGPVNADNISPTGWVRERGMMFGSHHDAPVAFPDSMRILSATVTRRTRSGDILGPAQRVDVMTALKAMTIWPAWQHFEESDKGSIEVGKIADFVLLSSDPTAVDPETLADIRVLETIKEGEVIYRAATDGTARTRDRVISNSPHGAHHLLDVLVSALGSS